MCVYERHGAKLIPRSVIGLLCRIWKWRSSKKFRVQSSSLVRIFSDESSKHLKFNGAYTLIWQWGTIAKSFKPPSQNLCESPHLLASLRPKSKHRAQITNHKSQMILIASLPTNNYVSSNNHPRHSSQFHWRHCADDSGLAFAQKSVGRQSGDPLSHEGKIRFLTRRQSAYHESAYDGKDRAGSPTGVGNTWL